MPTGEASGVTARLSVTPFNVVLEEVRRPRASRFSDCVPVADPEIVLEVLKAV